VAEDASALTGMSFRTVRGGRTGVLRELIGEGGQGAVYSGELGDTCFAIKWYHPSYADVDEGLRARLSRAIAQGAPNNAFLWPIDLVEIDGQPSFGYLMRLRDADYAGMRGLIARPPARLEPSLAIRALICLNLAQSFLELHAQGFCYQDVNFGNVFFRPATGDILICDNDNVDVDGALASVYGTRKFMAPEIVRREAMPSTKSDLFSMAVLFFYVFHAWHPLDGKVEGAIDVMDAAAESRLYGTAPVFLFDPSDPSNGPLAGMHEPISARWNGLTRALRELFIRAFTVGLHNPGSRVQEAEWRAAFAALANATFPCPACGFEHAIEAAADMSPGCRPVCACCGSALAPPAALSIGRVQICLVKDCVIPLHVLAPDHAFDMSCIGAAIGEHPARPGVLGMHNSSGVTWQLRLNDSTEVAVPPGSTMRLLNGASIIFGATRGLVTMPASLRVQGRS